MLRSALFYTHSLIKETVQAGDTVVDATVGNGQDTLLLAECVGETGHVIGFDIQKLAIDTAQHKLNEANLAHRVSLHLKGHEEIDTVISSSTDLSMVVYNLGYLPKGDKGIITTPDTTLKSVEQALDHLKSKGLILLMIYYGHEGGETEKDAVLNFVEQLPQNKFSVLQYQFINQKNSPPFLVAIEKR